MAKVTSETRYTEFGLGGENFAVAVTDITDILLIPAITPIPRVHPTIMGLFNLRGVVTELLDISPHFNLLRHPRSSGSRIIVLEPVAPELDDELRYAIWVDFVSDITTPDDEGLHVLPEDLSGSTFLKGFYNRDEQMVSVLDAKAVALQGVYRQYR